MITINRLEFYLPPMLIHGGEDEADGLPDHGNNSVSFTELGRILAQIGDDLGGDDTASSSYKSDSRERQSADDTDAVLQPSLENLLEAVPQEQKLLIKLLIEDVRDKKCKLEFDWKTGKVTVFDIEEESNLAKRIPEYTLKMSNVSHYEVSRKENEVDRFCDLVNFIKRKRVPGGVLLNDGEMRLGPGRQYRVGKEYDFQEGAMLGKGLNASVRVIQDEKTQKSHAEKSVSIVHFQTNEIQAMVSLNQTDVSPKLYAFKLEEERVTLFMEKLENRITVEDAVKQLSSTGRPENDYIQFGLYVFLQIAESVNTIHSKGWFHRDLHWGNVMIGKSETLKPKIKILDYGSAKSTAELTRSENKQDKPEALASDVCNMLRQLCSLVLRGDHFEDIIDFKMNFDRIVADVPGSLLSEENKQFLLEILQEGFKVKIVDHEREFIDNLKLKLGDVGTDSIEDIVCGLRFDDFGNIQSHVPRAVRLGTSPHQAAEGPVRPGVGNQGKAMADVLSGIKRIETNDE